MMTGPSNQLTNLRYGYYDALRGFTMLLVVYSHVFIISMDGLQVSSNNFFRIFRMPLFFFVSGFFAFKALTKWNKERIKDILFRKFQVQIVGAFVFMTVYTALCSHQIISPKALLYPGGYWFTFVLFRIFIVYISVVIVARLLKLERWFWWILAGISAICMFVTYYIPTHDYSKFPFAIKVILNLVSQQTLKYLPFFMLGAFARGKMNIFESLLKSDIVRIGCIGCVITYYFIISITDIPQPLNIIIDEYVIRVITLIMIIQFFYACRDYFDKRSKAANTIKFVGRRTLDIYFLHYFFLPNLLFLRPFVAEYNSIVLQLAIGITISVFITAITLLIGQVLRMSPVLAQWVLGTKRAKISNLHLKQSNI